MAEEITGADWRVTLLDTGSKRRTHHCMLHAACHAMSCHAMQCSAALVVMFGISATLVSFASCLLTPYEESRLSILPIPIEDRDIRLGATQRMKKWMGGLADQANLRYVLGSKVLGPQ